MIFDNTYSDLLFARGFIFSQDVDLRQVAIGKSLLGLGWHIHPTPLGSLLVHPRSIISVSDSGDVVCIGRAVNPIRQEPIEQSLARVAVDERVVDELSGMFVIFVFGDTVAVHRDACGLSALYAPRSGELCVASHASLLARFLGLEDDPAARAFILDRKKNGRGVAYFPGDATVYPGIRLLPANQIFHVDTGRCVRAFPRVTYQEQDLKTALDSALQILSSTVDLLKDHRLALSVTGGVDSRTSAALFKKRWRDMYFFTYVDPLSREFGIQGMDAIESKRLCRLMGVSHRVGVVRAGKRRFREFLEIWKENTAGSSDIVAARTAYWFTHGIPGDAIHIKSSVSEIFRSFWRKNRSLGRKSKVVEADELPLTLARAYNDEGDFSVSSFKNYCEQYDFNEASIKGYDPLDLFYWEHRMACWQSLHMIGYGAAQETIVIYNNRILLDALLRAPQAARLESSINKSIIEIAAPELLDVKFSQFRIYGALFDRIWRRISLVLLRDLG